MENISVINCSCRTIDELKKGKQLKGVTVLSMQNLVMELLNSVKTE